MICCRNRASRCRRWCSLQAFLGSPQDFLCNGTGPQSRTRSTSAAGRWPAFIPIAFEMTPPDGMITRDAPALPPAFSLALPQCGRERYEIACPPCHASIGDGDGIIVQRGFPAPPPLNDPRIVAEPTRHYSDVISNGYGIMYSFAERVVP
jgi:hypothetical protein